jgi:thiol-disulfide isomerase/thioredoxin
MKYLILLLATLFSFCNSNSHEEKKLIGSTIPIINNNNQCILINTTSQKIDFIYYDDFGNEIQFLIPPRKSKSIQIDSFTILVYPNLYQNKYIISKGDSIYISLNESNNVILSSKIDSNETTNLNISNYINEKLKYNAMQLITLIGSKGNSYRNIDSIVMRNYADQIRLLNEYNKKFGCSEIVKKYFNFEFKNYLINCKFYIAQRYKNELSPDYVKHLDSLNNKLDELYESPFINRNGNLRISYLAYKYEKGIRTISNDTLYSYSTNNTTVNKTDEEAKFWIVKNELQSNKKSSKWFIKDFKETCSNKDLVNYIVSLEENNKIIFNTDGKNKLLTLDKGFLNYDSLIKSYEGNIVYIDLWASWCAPCRANMPASLELNKRFKGKSIVFLYVSTDEKIQPWTKASEDENLEKTKSFLLLNSQNSNLIKKLKVISIPRYVIIGRNGKILNPDAPEPSDPLLIKEFTKLLEK